MPTILDVNFGREFIGWPETLEKNKAEKFAIKNSPSKFAEKFVGDFPKIRRTKIKNSPQIRSASRRDQNFGGMVHETILGHLPDSWLTRLTGALEWHSSCNTLSSST